MGKNIYDFLIGHKWKRVQLISVPLMLLACVMVGIIRGETLHDQWNNWINTFITIATLAIAVFVWVNETNTEWKQSLPKKLDVFYIFNGENYATVTNAPLAGEDDVRNWGQSIGKTILNKRANLSFSGFAAEAPQLDEKRHVMKYHISIFLTEEIQGIPLGSKFNFLDSGDMDDASKQLVADIK